jgi:small subunit ribosomal protein S15
MNIMAKNEQINLDQFRQNEKDTGSVEVQVAQFTERIKKLTNHFQLNAKDFASKRGMIKMVARRKKSLDYLEKKNPQMYKLLIDKLGIRR